MRRARLVLRHPRSIGLALAAVLAAVLLPSLLAGAATPVPIPDPVVMVTTKSGGFERTTPVPIGGAPVPIDVTGPSVTGLLEPDIDVSVGLVVLDELPDKPVVPNVVIARNPVAIATHRPAPPLDLDAKIVLRDGANQLKPLVEVHYGIQTPAGGRIPPIIAAKLVGPVQGGFIDPLQAKVESPGYGGPLKLKISALTDNLDARFALDFDALPESIFISEDPREDGLDVHYDHTASVADVHLDAQASLRNRQTNDLLEIGAEVERLPQSITLSNTNTAEGTHVAYDSSSALNKPDLEATYRDTAGDGSVRTDANIKVAGLPLAMRGDVLTVERNGKREIDKVDFRALNDDQVDAVDFVVRNYTGPSGNVPAPSLGPQQFVAVGQRRQADGSKRFRAAGRLLGIRSATVEMQGDANDVIDARTDIGDGTRPLRAILDLDDRGPGAPADAKRIRVDSSVVPLPRQIHTVFDPSTGATDPLRLLYESSSTVDVSADALIATGTANGCGQALVTCAKARIDKLPSRLEALLPGTGGTDFSLSHDGGATQHPDVSATIDTADKDAKRMWADVRILRVPNEVTGRLDSKDGTLRAAEFHACKWDFAASPPACTTPQDALGRVTFTARDRPDRSGLPPRKDTARTFVSIIKRDARFEAAGSVDEVRNVEFRQRETDPGTLGALVDVGSKLPFDAVVDTVEGAKSADVRVHVAQLPDRFSACVRKTVEAAQPAGLPQDSLLSPCETHELSAGEGEPVVTPLTAIYDASSNTDVTADVKLTQPDADDGNRPATTKVHTAILPLPSSLRVDAVPPLTPNRRLQLLYHAGAPIPQVDFGFESRRATDICGDPRPGRKALCVEGTLHDLPQTLRTTFDPDHAKGDIDFRTEPVQADGKKLSIDPLHLSQVSPGATDQPLLVDGKVVGLTSHMTGKLVQLHTPDDPPGEKSLAQMAFNACPDGECDGIDEIDVTATNALIGDPLPAAPPKDPDTTQDFSFVQRGLDYRAKVRITKFKEIGVSKLDEAGNPGPTTKVRAAFGDGSAAEKLNAYIDRETVTDPDTNAGLESQIVHAVIAQAPKAINLCYRDKLEPPDVPAPGNSESADFCDKAPADKLAVQARLDEAAGGEKPDIDLRRIHLSKGGGTDFLDGTVRIGDLGQRIDVLAGKGEATDVLVEGHDLGDGPGAAPKDVAGRVTFDLRNYDGTDAGTGAFPFESLSGATDPQADPRVDEGSEENFAKVVKDGDTLLLKGSIPHVKRVALRPGACHPEDPRFPAAGAFPSADVRPEYTCVNLIAAQGSPLGLAIRTRDAKNEILSLDEGYISSVPGGPDGILATLAKSPDAAKLNPTCGEPGGTAAAGCRPPLLSVEALKADGQQTNLQARLATGPLALVEDLRGVAPLDEISQRLSYEEPIADYAGRGARIKLGTGEAGTAIRAGLNLDLPNYVDLDQPLSYSCKRDDLDGGPLSPDDPACKQTDVSTKDNNGYESKDIAFRLVGANSGHLGTDVASLGRAAILIHSTDDGKQMVLTGPVPADPNADGTVGDDPTGSAPETLPPGGAWDRGLDLPGYLDARVFIRSKYEAPGEDDKQTTYYQIDGRVNSPLSLALRDVQSAALDGTLPTGRTRSGHDVAAMQLALRNAPAGTDYAKPTFRLRAEMRKKHAEADVGPYKCEGFNPGGGRTAGFGANFCLYVPGDHLEKWMDVGLNMNPTEGDSPARTVDVVMDSVDYTQIDMHAFGEVDGSGGPDGIDKGPFAAFTPQAGLRLQPFPIGLEMGVGLGIVGGNTKLLLDGDLILKLTGRRNERLRLSQNKGALRLLAENGPDPAATIKTDDFTHAIVQVRAEALFGLISENVVDVDNTFHQPVQFKKCAFPNLGIFVGSDDYFPVAPDDSTKTAIVLPPQVGGDAANVINAASELLAPIWCMVSTDDNQLVTSSHPAPAFTEPGRAINGGGEAPPPPSPPADDQTQQPADVTVGAGETATFCNRLGAKTVHVLAGGTLRVGNEGETITESLDNDGPGGDPAIDVVTTCTGKLAITADSVVVDDGGLITASATISSGGAGTPAAAGAGAGHAGGGGARGNGDAGGGTYGAATAPLDDIGSPAQGSGGGKGGGTLSIQAVDSITVNGTVAALGGNGSGGGSCTGGGGGSGGHVQLKANQVVVGGTGSVLARGGTGAGEGGGGGGGGRITIDTVDPRPASGLSAGGGAGGAQGACANAGGAGGDGALKGTTINHAAGVSFDTDQDVAPTFVTNAVPLRIRAVRNGGGSLAVLVCKRDVGPADADGLDSPALDPPGTTPGQIIDAAHCTSEVFAGPTSGGNVYERTITRAVSDGFHGFYAVAARRSGLAPDADCLDPGALPFNDGCTYQETVPGGNDVLPAKASVRVASDATAPSVSFSNPNGTPGCPGGRLCLSKAGVMSVAAADNTGGSGLSAVLCRIGGSGPFDIPCGPGDKVPVDLGTTDGAKDVQIRAIDRLGNARTISGPMWWADRQPGLVPTITRTYSDAAVNGWHKVKPTVTVHAEDDSAGFDPTPITLLTNTSAHHCGALSGGDLVADCSAAETEPFVPDNGIHSFQAFSTDKLGNLSLRSKVVTMKVDGKAPKAAIFLGPRAPDGNDDWYVTKPFVAFRAVDNVGGSGVRLTDPSGVSKIEFRVDGGSFQTWNPNDPNLLEDGIHSVCFRATDRAGNTSAAECKGNIKVDTTAPAVSDPITPAAPDGDNAFYVTTPSADGAGSDPAGAASAGDRSGLDRVEMQVDGGNWRSAGPTAIAEGEHSVRTRAFDRAGNASPILERTVRVDRSDPSATLRSFPPAPNGRGWFRRALVNSIASFDGRDGSGSDGATFTIDSEGPSSYVGPFAVGEGVREVGFRARDYAGRQGAREQRTQRIDTTAPSASPTGKAKNILIQAAGIPSSTTLAFTAGDALSPRVRVRVTVYNVLNVPVRTLSADGPYADGYRDTGAGSVTWNGRDERDRGVAPGVYYYRVHVTDMAGNTVLSEESPTFLVVLGVLPL